MYGYLSLIAYYSCVDINIRLNCIIGGGSTVLQVEVMAVEITDTFLSYNKIEGWKLLMNYQSSGWLTSLSLPKRPNITPGEPMRFYSYGYLHIVIIRATNSQIKFQREELIATVRPGSNFRFREALPPVVCTPLPLPTIMYFFFLNMWFPCFIFYSIYFSILFIFLLLRIVIILFNAVIL